jgi:hypothetical protein
MTPISAAGLASTYKPNQINISCVPSEPCYKENEVFLLPYSTGGKDAAIGQTQAVPDEHGLGDRRFTFCIRQGRQQNWWR